MKGDTEPAPRLGAIVGVLAALFLIGFTLMGYEMLGSRYLNPYFGGGITTWASLISVVLLAMMAGYFTGGLIVDARPGIHILVASILVAGAAMAVVPSIADALCTGIVRSIGDGFWGVLTASIAISFVPIALLSACSPAVVRLLLVDLSTGGKTAGIVYSVSTLGNVVGTLTTTFLLIPSFGTRLITLVFGTGLMILAGVLYLARHHLASGLRIGAAALALVAALASSPYQGARAEQPVVTAPIRLQASYPEGPIWIGDRLLYTEMPRHHIVAWTGGTNLVELWREEGCGPTAISTYRQGELIVLCHLAGKLVRLDAGNKKIGEFLTSTDGERLRDPNDCITDGAGGVFFSDAGTFSKGAPATGKIYHLAPDGRLTKLIDGLHYANGVAYDAKARALYVSEHLDLKMWRYQLGPDLKPTGRTLALDVAKHLTASEMTYPETGPDGIEIDHEGNIFVPIYGSSRMLMIVATGGVRKITVPMQYVTNIAVTPSTVAVVGAFLNDRPSLPGLVEIMPRAQFLAKATDTAATAK